MTVLIKGEVSDKIADLLSSASLVVLLKKDAETMAEIKRVIRDAYLRPQRPLGMESTFVKLASSCALSLLRGNIGPAIGPT
jgi:hypothetical protein